ncbi:MAG: hypothetical protein A4E57_02209 [Syntrophorhabdaceae bacterium PtaU1.Bin034]|nr:MAG: hypothetical protein A4E57_02209 [Syntrophorhabdaceae bacterium PtaU1.Bin034]
MKRQTFKALALIIGLVFLVSILTVESHANVKGDLAEKCPTIIESTLELAVINIYCERSNEVFTAIDYLPIPAEIFFVSKSTISPFIYRGPPKVAF